MTFRRLLVLLLIIIGGLTACSDNVSTPIHTTLPYVAMARGVINVEGGLINVAFAHEGIIDKIVIKNGMHVSEGDVLAKLNEQSAILATSLAKAELNHAVTVYKALQARLPALEARASRLRTGVTEGVVEGQQASEAEESLRQLQADIPTAAVDITIAQQRLAQVRFDLSQRTLVSPVAGEVVNVAAQLGSIVNTQEHNPAFVILPDTPFIIRAEVNESYIDRIHVGQNAEIEAEARTEPFPTTAHVFRIGRVVEAGHLGDEPSAGRVVRCDLALDNLSSKERQNLRIGQTVLVKFHD